MSVARLSVVCCMLSVVCCLLSVVCCLLSGVWCLVSVVCCLLSVICYLLSVVCCLLSGVYVLTIFFIWLLKIYWLYYVPLIKINGIKLFLSFLVLYSRLPIKDATSETTVLNLYLIIYIYNSLFIIKSCKAIKILYLNLFNKISLSFKASIDFLKLRKLSLKTQMFHAKTSSILPIHFF